MEIVANLPSDRRQFGRQKHPQRSSVTNGSNWVLHAWTMDAGDISPLMVLVSPTKRCGKTSVLILLCFLTPRSELSSNITEPALFRYIEDVRRRFLSTRPTAS